MKLIVQIPCYNEEKTLPLVVNSIPRRIPGVDIIETLVMDDGSTDQTVEIARQLGVNHIIRNRQNRGLAITFSEGLHKSLELGADIIVNTDADNQYPQKDIPRLIQPILEGKADIVVGDRQVGTISHFSPLKKLLQKVGSAVVRLASSTSIPDAPSGFRAYSREAAMSLNVVTQFSYLMETTIQAGKKRIAISSIPITTNPKTRESRLFKNMFQHVRQSGAAIIRSYAMHAPFKIFLAGGILVFLIGIIPYVRMGWLIAVQGELIGGHIQSLILGAVFMILGFILAMIGLVADLLSINRKLIEDTLYRLKKIEFDHTGNIRREVRRLVAPEPEVKKEKEVLPI